MTSAIGQRVNSRLGRGTISAVISLAVLAAAAFVLYELLHDADFGKVFATLKAQSVQKITIAAIFVVAGYVTLTFYDYFALHAIGRGKVPYAVAALASFTSFTIGHSLGAAVLTGGLIRFRIYSAWGLTVLDIAKIAFITSITFWLGNAFLLGGATAYAPEAAAAVDHLPLWINRTIGVSALVAIACYLLWLAPRRRVIGRSGWRIVLPSLRFTLVQIGIGALDLTLITLAMYAVLPPNPPVGFITMMVPFLTATLLGTVSHAPGGLGVIEVTMLLGLPQFQREELLAALLTFRALYFVLPLLLATLSLGVRELHLLTRSASARRDHGA
ncbi:MAG: lysylphosphatidylglycerol synthase transmembrane domain-containing protein [Xanthobacteraceae bacterium]